MQASETVSLREAQVWQSQGLQTGKELKQRCQDQIIGLAFLQLICQKLYDLLIYFNTLKKLKFSNKNIK